MSVSEQAHPLLKAGQNRAPAMLLSCKTREKLLPLGPCRIKWVKKRSRSTPVVRNAILDLQMVLELDVRLGFLGTHFGVPLSGTRDRPRRHTLMRVSQRTEVDHEGALTAVPDNLGFVRRCRALGGRPS